MSPQNDRARMLRIQTEKNVSSQQNPPVDVAWVSVKTLLYHSAELRRRLCNMRNTHGEMRLPPRLPVSVWVKKARIVRHPYHGPVARIIVKDDWSKQLKKYTIEKLKDADSITNREFQLNWMGSYQNRELAKITMANAVQNPTRFALFTRGAEAAESCQWFHFPSENQHQEPTFPSCLSKVRCSFAKMWPELFSCLVRAVDATWSELNNWSRRRCHLWSWKVKVVTCKFCKHPGAQSLTAD
jgi:hypothetical protein